MADETTDTKKPPEQTAPASAEEQLTFSPEQQEFFNKTLNKRYAEIQKRSDARVAALENELNELRSKVQPDAQKSEEPTQSATKSVDKDKLEAKLLEATKVIDLYKAKEETFQAKLLAEQKEKQNLNDKLLKERKDNAILNACQKEQFISPIQAKKLVEDLIRYDAETDSWKVFGENGEERFDEQLRPLSIEGCIKEFAVKNPHLVQGSKAGGTGSTEASRKTGKKWTRSEISKMSKADFSQHEEEIMLAYKEGRVVSG